MAERPLWIRRPRRSPRGRPGPPSLPGRLVTRPPPSQDVAVRERETMLEGMNKRLVNLYKAYTKMAERKRRERPGEDPEKDPEVAVIKADYVAELENIKRITDEIRAIKGEKRKGVRSADEVELARMNSRLVDLYRAYTNMTQVEKKGEEDPEVATVRNEYFKELENIKRVTDRIKAAKGERRRGTIQIVDETIRKSTEQLLQFKESYDALSSLALALSTTDPEGTITTDQGPLNRKGLNGLIESFLRSVESVSSDLFGMSDKIRKDFENLLG